MKRPEKEPVIEQAETIRKETRKHIERKIEDVGSTHRADFSEALVVGSLLKPLDNPEKQLKEFREKGGNDPESRFILELMERSEQIKRMVDKMSPDQVRMTAQSLGKLDQYGKKFADLLMEDPEGKYAGMKEAVKWVIGYAEAGETVQSKETEAKEAIIDGLVDREHDQHHFAYACMALALTNSNNRVEIAGKFLKEKLGEADLKQLNTEKFNQAKRELLAMNEMGAISRLEIEELLGKDNFVTDMDAEFLEKCAQNWEQKQELSDFAKYLSKDSIGAYNAANEMFTFRNFLRLFAYFSGGATLIVNSVANWRSLKDDPVGTLTNNPYFAYGGLMIAGANAAGSDKTLNEYLASKSERENWNRNKAFSTLTNTLAASPKWQSLLEGDNYAGVKALSEFMLKNSKDGEINMENVNLERFEAFIAAKRLQGSPAAGLEQRLEELKIDPREHGNLERKFLDFAAAFDVLKIGGNNPHKKYLKSIEEAKKA